MGFEAKVAGSIKYKSNRPKIEHQTTSLPNFGSLNNKKGRISFTNLAQPGRADIFCYRKIQEFDMKV